DNGPRTTNMLPTIHSAADDLRAGRLSPPDLLDACLERIDRAEERVRAWVFVDRDRAREEAEARAAELRRGGWRGPLHGIPVGIKDAYDVFDWPTAAGSRLWRQSIARHDAAAVRRLRQAGAVLLGKTVTTQYASFDPPPTRNPWNRDRTPGGSSSGSAAAAGPAARPLREPGRPGRPADDGSGRGRAAQGRGPGHGRCPAGGVLRGGGTPPDRDGRRGGGLPRGAPAPPPRGLRAQNPFA